MVDEPASRTRPTDCPGRADDRGGVDIPEEIGVPDDVHELAHRADDHPVLHLTAVFHGQTGFSGFRPSVGHIGAPRIYSRGKNVLMWGSYCGNPQSARQSRDN
jgi:hypothetical protein